MTGYDQHTSSSKLHVASKVLRRETRNEEEGFRFFLE